MRDSQSEERDFLGQIDEWVLERWQQRARTLEDILSGLPGIYPSEVIRSLRRLCEDGVISEFNVLAVELGAASTPLLHHKPVPLVRRSIEHPLDFEWRFTRRGVSRICEEIDRFRLKPKSRVLCLGCPSVYLFGKENRNHLNFQLWDKNIPLTGQIEEAREICRVDLHKDLPGSISASAVVIDPPWYLGFYELFIWAAFYSLPLGGRLLLSFPPKGTRPGIAQEFAALVKWCSIRGLVLEKIQPACLPYRSPLFEVNALKAEGVTNFPLNWRRGDLAVFIKQRSNLFPKPAGLLPKEKWQEIAVEGCRIKINTDQRIGGAHFRAAGEIEITPSVSSKHPDRKSANIVTSGNRFIRTSIPEKLLSCFAAIDTSGPGKMKRHFLASKTPILMKKVGELISKEKHEAAAYFRRIHEL